MLFPFQVATKAKECYYNTELVSGGAEMEKQTSNSKKPFPPSSAKTLPMQVALLDGKKRNFRLTQRIRAGIGYPVKKECNERQRAVIGP